MQSSIAKDSSQQKEVLKILKVHYQTLYRMEEKGEIDVKRTNGGSLKIYANACICIYFNEAFHCNAMKIFSI